MLEMNPFVEEAFLHSLAGNLARASNTLMVPSSFDSKVPVTADLTSSNVKGIPIFFQKLIYIAP